MSENSHMRFRAAILPVKRSSNNKGKKPYKPAKDYVSAACIASKHPACYSLRCNCKCHRGTQ